MVFNKEEVLQFLPHRDPFLFIDSVEEVSIPGLDGVAEQKELKDGIVKARFHAREDLEIFRGHFPDYPVLPGVIQVEIMAQASAFLVSRLHAEPLKMKIEVAFMGVNDVKFRKPVTPGMDLDIECVCTRVRGGIMSYDCKIESDGVLISQASILASVKYTLKEGV